MSKFRQTTILRPFFDIFERLPKTQNFFLLKNYPPALQKPFLKIQRGGPLDVEKKNSSNQVFIKAMLWHLFSRFQNGITLDYTTSGGGRNKILSSSKPRPTSLKQTSRYLTPKCYTFLKSAGPGQFNGFDKICDTTEIKDATCLQ